MIHNTIQLENTGYGKNNPTLVTYIQENVSEEINQRPAILICPGGGYEFTSNRESEPMALAFLDKGYHAFVLNYTVLDNLETRPVLPYCLEDVKNAIEYIKQYSKNIILLGCSAGGHLCATYGNLYPSDINSCILCYPVIDLTLGWPKEIDRIETITTQYIKAQDFVSSNTPPTFIWHTNTDDGVPAINTLSYVMKLYEHQVNHECHTFHKGKHGLSLATKQSAKKFTSEYINIHVSKWIDLACEWLEENIIE